MAGWRTIWTLLLAGCSSGAPAGYRAAAPACAFGGGGGGGGGGNSNGGDGGASPPVTLAVGATRATLGLTQRATSIVGSGSSRVGAIALHDGVGTLVIDGVSVAAAVFDRSDVGGSPPLTIFHTLALEPDRWRVVYLYCRQAQLSELYFEGSDGLPMTEEPAASGDCTPGDTDDEALRLPATAPAPVLLPAWTLAGDHVAYDGLHPGRIDADGGALTLLPFASVDCRSCAANGWYELHSLLWAPAREQLAFGIVYLYPQQPSHIVLAHTVTLPSLCALAGSDDQLVYTASWTHAP